MYQMDKILLTNELLEDFNILLKGTQYLLISKSLLDALRYIFAILVQRCIMYVFKIIFFCIFDLIAQIQ